MRLRVSARRSAIERFRRYRVADARRSGCQHRHVRDRVDLVHEALR
jgi:hypothetical protein